QRRCRASDRRDRRICERRVRSARRDDCRAVRRWHRGPHVSDVGQHELCVRPDTQRHGRSDGPRLLRGRRLGRTAERPRLVIEPRPSPVRMSNVRVSAKLDYALRAVIELAAAGDGPVKGERIAQAQMIPLKFLENILGDLRQAGIVRSQRGAEGGYWLARPADEISVADVVRTVEGPIANVRGIGPESVSYSGSAERLQDVWIAVRANLRAVLERVTIADVARGELPDVVDELVPDPDASQPHV